MPIIHLVGPNAIGKSTAVLRWARRYGGLTVASLDLLRKATPYPASKRVYLKEHSSGTVLVSESVYTNQIVQARLTVASCDSESHGVTLRGDQRLEGYDWKGDITTKAGCVDKLRIESPMAVTESARTTVAQQATKDEPVIIVVCPGEKLGNHMKARCASRNKTFRAEYWTDKKLEYEANRRYLNFAAKYLDPKQYEVFWINEQARDWPAVDEYFGVLFRRLHNHILREKQRS